MAYSLYDATVCMAKNALTALDGILTEAEKCPNSINFLHSRLIEDMNPLSFQVHYATLQCMLLSADLSGKERYTEPEETLKTYKDMHERIEQAIKMLNEVNKETANSIGEEMKEIQFRDQPKTVPVKALTGLAQMPNIYFHVNMAYAILRKEGVPLGKKDWIRPFVSGYI